MNGPCGRGSPGSVAALAVAGGRRLLHRLNITTLRKVGGPGRSRRLVGVGGGGLTSVTGR